MNIDSFMLKHKKHRRAIWTVYWFLNGKADLQEIFRITVILTSWSIAQNITRNNPLYEKLAKNKAA